MTDISGNEIKFQGFRKLKDLHENRTHFLLSSNLPTERDIAANGCRKKQWSQKL